MTLFEEFPHSLCIRADTTPSMGTGHVMRCLALAQAAQHAGMNVRFVGRIHTTWVQQRLSSMGFPIKYIEGPPPLRENLKDMLAQIGIPAVPGRDWLVLDGYHFGGDCHRAALKTGWRLLVLDDFCHLPEYHCHLLLNQNVGAQQFAYKGNIGQTLLGLDYALLRPEFVAARTRGVTRTHPTEPHTLLLNLGGGDFSFFLREIAGHFHLPELAGSILRVLAGDMPAETIRACLNACPAHLDILHDVHDMPALLLDTDMCVTAGGSTCWELCCLGVPFLVLALADNQRGIAECLVREEAALPYSGNALHRLLTSEALRGGLREKASCLVDGKGARRVVKALVRTPEVPVVTLRHVSIDDCPFIFAIANDPVTRAASFHRHQISVAEHEAWFAEQLEKKMPFYVALYQNFPCGYVRFSGDTGEVTLSIALEKRLRGQGIGGHLLRIGCKKLLREHNVRCIIAHVKRNNYPSLRIFTAAGFSEDLGAPCSYEFVRLCYYIHSPHSGIAEEINYDSSL